MAAAFSVALLIVIVIRLHAPPAHRVDAALRATARWSFAWFWLASTGGALTALFGSRFRPIAQHARDFGLAYASAHVVHLSLVAWVLYGSVTAFDQTALIFFGIGVFWTYLLALLSIKSLAARVNPTLLRILRIVGVEYIGVVFLVDFSKHLFETGLYSLLYYLPFQLLAVAGPLLRLTVLLRRWLTPRTVNSPIQSS
jgi:hypothetical protein